MFNEEFKNKFDKVALLIIVYSLVFMLFFSTLSYTLPFVIAFVVAALTKPITRFLRVKFKLSDTVAALVSTIALFIILSVVLTSLIFKITYETRQLMQSLPDTATIRSFIEIYMNKIMVYFNQLDSSIVAKFETQILSLFSTGLDITFSILNRILLIALGLPVILMIIFITLLATFFFSKDLPNVKESVLSIFSNDSKNKFSQILSETSKMVFGYIKAFSLVIFISFIQTFIGFSILKVNYALLLSILAACFDVLPVLGIGSVYFPLILYNVVIGNYFTAITLLVLYVVVSIVRQIVEPKLVSSSIGLHPVAILACIFIGLKAYGFLGMIYLILLLILFKSIKKINII